VRTTAAVRVGELTDGWVAVAGGKGDGVSVESGATVAEGGGSDPPPSSLLQAATDNRIASIHRRRLHVGFGRVFDAELQSEVTIVSAPSAVRPQALPPDGARVKRRQR
jgi:hypothetical protein